MPSGDASVLEFNTLIEKMIAYEVETSLPTYVHDLDRSLALNERAVHVLRAMGAHEPEQLLPNDKDAQDLSEVCAFQKRIVAYVREKHGIELFLAKIVLNASKETAAVVMRDAIQNKRLPPFPTSKDAIDEYRSTFPHGHKVVLTESDGLKCGARACCIAMRQVVPDLFANVSANATSFLDLIKNEEYVDEVTKFGLQTDRVFMSDQLGIMARIWGHGWGYNFRVGVVRHGHAPILVPFQPPIANKPTHILWICNDDAEHKHGRIGHWSGMEPRTPEEKDDPSESEVFH